MSCVEDRVQGGENKSCERYGRRERAYIDGEECWAHSVARAIRKVSTRKRIIDSGDN